MLELKKHRLMFSERWQMGKTIHLAIDGALSIYGHSQAEVPDSTVMAVRHFACTLLGVLKYLVFCSDTSFVF